MNATFLFYFRWSGPFLVSKICSGGLAIPEKLQLFSVEGLSLLHSMEIGMSVEGLSLLHTMEIGMLLHSKGV